MTKTMAELLTELGGDPTYLTCGGYRPRDADEKASESDDGKSVDLSGGIIENSTGISCDIDTIDCRNSVHGGTETKDRKSRGDGEISTNPVSEARKHNTSLEELNHEMMNIKLELFLDDFRDRTMDYFSAIQEYIADRYSFLLDRCTATDLIEFAMKYLEKDIDLMLQQEMDDPQDWETNESISAGGLDGGVDGTFS